MYRCVFPGSNGGELYAVFRFWHNAMAGQCQLVAVSAVDRKNETVIYAKVGDFPVSELIQVFGRLISCQQIIIINVNGLVGVLTGFPDQNIGEFFPVQIFDHGIILPGIEQDKAVCLPDAGHGPDSIQHFILILTGYDGADIMLLVADLADAADRFQIKGVFIDLTGRYRKDNADGACVSGGQIAGLEIWFIAQLLHGISYFAFCFFADGRTVFTGAGNRRGRYTSQCGYILDCHGHDSSFLSTFIKYGTGWFVCFFLILRDCGKKVNVSAQIHAKIA